MRRRDLFEAALAIALLFACSRGERRGESSRAMVPSTCTNLPFFQKYRRLALATSARDEEIRIELPVDVHSADCSVPDDYGHRMTLLLTLNAVAGKCSIRSATADGRPFGGPAGSSSMPWHDTYLPVNDPNLADTALGRVELRDLNTRHALLLMPRAYYFYEDVGPTSQLLPALEPEAATDCCYGYTSAAFSEPISD